MLFLITGASHGIGQFLSRKYAQDGYAVYGTYNSSPPQDRSPVRYAKVDVTNEDDVSGWINSICFDDESRIVLLNCAGINYSAQLHKSISDKWRAVVEVNLFGVYYATKHIIPIMRQKKWGRIINLSSVVPSIGVPGTSAYSASKASLAGLCKSVAIENSKYGITVNNINLGYFDLGMIEQVPAQMLADIVGRIPIGELGKPEELKKAMDYILSADYITGSSIDLTGGL